MYELIPEELKMDTAWVNVWNTSKIPMQSGCRKAASSDSSYTWSTYQQALQAVQNGTYDGIGYVFHDTGLVGVDIDCGFDEDRILTELASDVMAKCQSYTEKSRSGRGIHIILRGSLPFRGRNNRAGVEIYKTSRYFIMTGNVLIFDKIVENQPAIDYILSEYFKEEAMPKGNITKSYRVYDPVWGRPSPNRIPLRPSYPAIGEGSRNLSLASLAGLLHNTGYSPRDIYKELLRCNQEACEPPLSTGEVQTIVRSITRYRR